MPLLEFGVERGADDHAIAFLAAFEGALLMSEAAVDDGGEEDQAEQDNGDQSDRGSAKVGDINRVGEVRGAERRGNKVGGGHADVVHDGNGETHQEGAAELQPAPCTGRVTLREGDTQSHERDHHGRYDRRSHEGPGVETLRGHAHGGHADVVHAGDTAAHDEAAAEGCRNTHRFAAHHEKSDARSADSGGERQEDSGPVIQDRHLHAEREHSDVMHRPYADAHGNSPAEEPGKAR